MSPQRHGPTRFSQPRDTAANVFLFLNLSDSLESHYMVRYFSGLEKGTGIIVLAIWSHGLLRVENKWVSYFGICESAANFLVRFKKKKLFFEFLFCGVVFWTRNTLNSSKTNLWLLFHPCSANLDFPFSAFSTRYIVSMWMLVLHSSSWFRLVFRASFLPSSIRQSSLLTFRSSHFLTILFYSVINCWKFFTDFYH